MWVTFFGFYITFLIGFWIRRRLITYGTWKKLGIKGPKPSLFFGNLFELYKTKGKLPDEVIEEWFKKYGKVVGYFKGDQPYLLINDAHILNEIFIKNSKKFYNRADSMIKAEPIIYSLIFLKDNNYQRVRKLMSPLFKEKVITSFFINIFEDCVKNFCFNLNPNQNSSTFVIDIYEKIQCFTFDVILKSLLNIETNVYEKDNILMNAAKTYFKSAENQAVLFATVFPFLASLLAFINNYLTAGKMTDILVHDLKKKISAFLKSKKNDSKFQNNLIVSMLNFLKNNKISQNEFIGNVYLMLLAGFETTSNALTYTLYLLAKYPEIQEKAFQEIIKLHSNLDYIKMIWLESLRYYPPVTLFLNRKASCSCTVNGINIKKGVIIQAPVWSFHHSPHYWKDPWNFDPERFSNSNRDTFPSHAFLPFGLGFKICLGMNYANEEAKIFLSRVIEKYKISFCDQTLDQLEFVCVNVIRNPAKPIYLQFQLRN